MSRPGRALAEGERYGQLAWCRFEECVEECHRLGVSQVLDFVQREYARCLDVADGADEQVGAVLRLRIGLALPGGCRRHR